MELEKILHNVVNEIKDFYYQPNLRHIDDYELEDFATNYGVRTQHGSLAFSSTVKNPSLSQTVYVGGKDITQRNLSPIQKEILNNLSSTLVKVHHYARKIPFSCVEKTICNNDKLNFHCTLLTSLYKKENVRLPFMWSKSVFDLSQKQGLKLHLICIPEWPSELRQTIVFPEIGVTYVLGSDHFDEVRKGFLRMAMWFAKTNGIFPLNASSKLVSCWEDKSERVKNYAALLIGPPGVGKTALSVDDMGLNNRIEQVKIFQNDVSLIRKYSQILGTERVLWVKTDEVDSHIQPTIWRSMLSKKTNFENVVIDHQGRIDFQDSTLTNNGRALIQIGDLRQDSDDINLPPIEELDGLKIFLITKVNTVLPPVCKLENEQAVLFFLLGENLTDSYEPGKKEIIRTPACNPYLIGHAEDDAEGLLNFIENNKDKTEVYLLNTGIIGESPNTEGIKKNKSKPRNINIQELSLIMRNIFKGKVVWDKSRYWNFLVPRKIKNMNLDKYALENFYSADEIKKLVSEFRIERQKYLENFPKLPPCIKKVVI